MKIEEIRSELINEIDSQREMHPDTKAFIKAGINMMAKRLDGFDLKKNYSI